MSIFGRRNQTSAAADDTTVALAGAGAIAVVHALAAPTAGCRVVAVASAGGASARHLAAQLSEQQRGDVQHVAVGDLPGSADVLIVATPPDTHAALAMAGLAAGADVLVEKPFATTLADADRLVDAARTAGDGEGTAGPGGSGPILRCAENLLHAPAWQAALAHRASMGPLQHLSARTLQPPPNWGHFNGPLSAGGVLFDLGPHPLALVMAMAAEPVVGVRASLSSTRDDGADDDAQVLLRFRSGLVTTVDVSWTNPEVEWSLQAASADGVVRLELSPDVLVELDGEPIVVADRHPSAVDPALERMGYVDQLVDMARTGVVSQTPEQARDVLEVICAAYASAATASRSPVRPSDGPGEEVPVPFDGDRSATPLQLWRG